MRRLLRFARLLALFALALATAVFMLNTNLLAPQPLARPLIIAHRGLGQTFHREGITGQTCTAERIFPPEHPYLENTIAGFAAAFAAGADIVEFDVHPTTDGHFVVFHDWTLDCRTERPRRHPRPYAGRTEGARHRLWLHRRWRQRASRFAARVSA